MTTSNTGAKASAFWRRVEEIATSIANERINDYLGNYRPKGLANLAASFGNKTDGITVSSTLPEASITCPFPAELDYILIRGEPSGSVTFAVKIIRPGQTAAQMTSIVGTPACVLSGTLSLIDLSLNTSWVKHIEAGSSLEIFITAASGTMVGTINFVPRCL